MNVHDKQSLMIIISSFSSCVPLLSQFRKSVGPCPALYKYNGDVVMTLYCIVKTIAYLSKRPSSVFLNHKSILVLRMKHSRHGDYVNGDVAKTGDKLPIHCDF